MAQLQHEASVTSVFSVSSQGSTQGGHGPQWTSPARTRTGSLLRDALAGVGVTQPAAAARTQRGVGSSAAGDRTSAGGGLAHTPGTHTTAAAFNSGSTASQTLHTLHYGDAWGSAGSDSDGTDGHGDGPFASVGGDTGEDNGLVNGPAWRRIRGHNDAARDADHDFSLLARASHAEINLMLALSGPQRGALIDLVADTSGDDGTDTGSGGSGDGGGTGDGVRLVPVASAATAAAPHASSGVKRPRREPSAASIAARRLRHRRSATLHGLLRHEPAAQRQLAMAASSAGPSLFPATEALSTGKLRHMVARRFPLVWWALRVAGLGQTAVCRCGSLYTLFMGTVCLLSFYRVFVSTSLLQLFLVLLSCLPPVVIFGGMAFSVMRHRATFEAAAALPKHQSRWRDRTAFAWVVLSVLLSAFMVFLEVRDFRHHVYQPSTFWVVGLTLPVRLWVEFAAVSWLQAVCAAVELDGRRFAAAVKAGQMSPGAASVDLITLLSRASSVTRSVSVTCGAYLLVLTFFVVVVSAESVFIDQWKTGTLSAVMYVVALVLNGIRLVWGVATANAGVQQAVRAFASTRSHRLMVAHQEAQPSQAGMAADGTNGAAAANAGGAAATQDRAGASAGGGGARGGVPIPGRATASAYGAGHKGGMWAKGGDAHSGGGYGSTSLHAFGSPFASSVTNGLGSVTEGGPVHSDGAAAHSAADNGIHAASSSYQRYRSSTVGSAGGGADTTAAAASSARSTARHSGPASAPLPSASAGLGGATGPASGRSNASTHATTASQLSELGVCELLRPVRLLVQHINVMQSRHMLGIRVGGVCITRARLFVVAYAGVSFLVFVLRVNAGG